MSRLGSRLRYSEKDYQKNNIEIYKRNNIKEQILFQQINLRQK